jgi:hypothetical protein
MLIRIYDKLTDIVASIWSYDILHLILLFQSIESKTKKNYKQ